jgi:hypothetical protein
MGGDGARSKEFLTQFGRKMRRSERSRILEAFSFVQRVNKRSRSNAPDTQSRFMKSMEAMEAAEKRLFGPPPPPPTCAGGTIASPARQPARDYDAPMRVGGAVKAHKTLRRVDEVRRARGSVILDIASAKPVA